MESRSRATLEVNTKDFELMRFIIGTDNDENNNNKNSPQKPQALSSLKSKRKLAYKNKINVGVIQQYHVH